MDPRNCGYCKNCAVGNYDACTDLQPSASAEPVQEVPYKSEIFAHIGNIRAWSRMWAKSGLPRVEAIGRALDRIDALASHPPVTAAREQEASATGAEPVAANFSDPDPHWTPDHAKGTGGLAGLFGAHCGKWPKCGCGVECKSGDATPTTSTTGKDLTDGAVFHLASRIANLINRHDGKAETLMPELRALVQDVIAVTGKVDASRVRDEALESESAIRGRA